jgi:RNA 2',3'-cyclic 3'-phosphodiesterase
MTEAARLLRSFIAVPLPGAVQMEIAEAARALALDVPRVKWSKKPENFHVTLKFLGAVATERLTALQEALTPALAEVPRFEMELRGFGAFPSARAGSVMFAGVVGEAINANEDGRLAGCAAVVESVAERLGFEREARRFQGHITVGRYKGGGLDVRAALEPWADRHFGKVFVDEVHVYESRLSQVPDTSSTYVLRGRLPLGARAAN